SSSNGNSLSFVKVDKAVIDIQIAKTKIIAPKTNNKLFCSGPNPDHRKATCWTIASSGVPKTKNIGTITNTESPPNRSSHTAPMKKRIPPTTSAAGPNQGHQTHPR